MENETPQNETGGLKLVTVFIAVLALHVLVIGGISIYNLLKTPNLDAAHMDYTQAPRPDPANYNTYEPSTGTELTSTSSSEPAAGLSSVETTTSAPAPQSPTPTFEARLSVPEPPAPTVQTPTPAPEPALATQAPTPPQATPPLAAASPTPPPTATTLPEASIPYTPPSLSDGVPPGYGGMQEPFATTTPATAPQQVLAENQTLLSPPDPAATPSPTAITHEIKPGETLGKIRSLYGVSLQELMAWNNIKDPNKIRAGQKLVIQRSGTVTVPAPDTSSPSLHAATAPTSPAPTKTNAKVAQPKPKKTVIPSSVAVHRVAPGETLYSIARKYDTTVDKILAVNAHQLTDPSRLRVGMRLALPAHTTLAKKTKKQTPDPSRQTSTVSIPISTDIVMR
ncbi:MAG: LysM peptidoglycan-binding domain-containing protein [Methylacidiphilales bacterium]|nr:LysM peptidoglycan-binding domain-containing protein [Candidatus Methylacidiphilales bacterium]MDW8349797.1 LysM peptidoglycan-binding domain-containing protein [Verrucomicrobiae bacterium]